MGTVVVSSGLVAEVVAVAGSLTLELEVEVGVGETVAIVGPNGAGKTTALRVLAGLHPLQRGGVILGGRVLDDPSTGVHVPAEDRSIGVAFQHAALFPHLSALDNVAFGLRHRGRRDRRQVRGLAAEWLERFGLAELAHLRPQQMSGGQAQRVALARAVATEPQLLLLDEPMSALDVQARAEMRRAVVRYMGAHSGCRVLVTHDPVEAIALADRIVVLEDGRASQSGSVEDLLRRPRSRYVADLVGLNMFRGTAAAGHVTLGGGAVLAVADHAQGEVLAVAHPRAVAMFRNPPGGTPRNVWHCTIVAVERHADRVRVRLEGAVPLVAEVTAAAWHDLSLEPGSPVWASLKATEIEVYPA